MEKVTVKESIEIQHGQSDVKTTLPPGTQIQGETKDGMFYFAIDRLPCRLPAKLVTPENIIADGLNT